jgi:general secretion pathway protein G
MDKTITYQNGFTLIEILIVMGIMGVLAGISIPVYFNYIHRAKIAKAAAEIRIIEKEILAFEIGSDADILPVTLAQIELDGMLDPWGNPYQYYNVATATGNGIRRVDGAANPINTDFDLYSLGRNGITNPSITDVDGQDDIVYANNGRFVGLSTGL